MRGQLCDEDGAISTDGLADSVAARLYPAPMSQTALDDTDTVVGSLSPSRASDFKTCPLLYRLRSIDRLPEAPSRAAARGTVVHAALERLYDLPPRERTPQAAVALVEPEWQRLCEQAPGLLGLFAADGADGADSADSAEGAADLAGWLDSARELVAGYFTLEDPTCLQPAEREQLVEVVVDGLRLRGYVDRLDVSPAGDLRVVDYKTGSIPREAFEAKALFQMKFYALVLWRTRGVVPLQLKLIYLADRDTLTYAPEAEELARFERTLHAIWAAIARATERQEFRACPSRLCDWCSFQRYCPAFGGVPPAFPVETAGGGDPGEPVESSVVPPEL